jgi:hypothetical protein
MLLPNPRLRKSLYPNLKTFLVLMICNIFNPIIYRRMENIHVERLAFIRQGEDGMAVELVGRMDTIRNMVRAALQDNMELRKLLMPVIVDLMQDKEFMLSLLDDVITEVIDNASDKEDSIELD